MLDFTLSGKEYFNTLPQPVLLYGNTIEYCNDAARSLFAALGVRLEAGGPVPEELSTVGTAPCTVTLRLNERSWQAVLRPLDGKVLCQLAPVREEGDEAVEQLHRLSLQLRLQLSNAALSLERLQWELSELEQRRSGELVARVNRNFHQLLRLTDHLDLYTRSNGELMDLYPTSPLNLADLCGEVSASVEQAARQMGQRFTLECEPDSCPVLANSDLLCRVLLNLLSNALHSGGDLSLRLRERGDCALLTLRNSGAGLDLSLLPTLFAPEQREQGFALGLPLCRRIVQLYGGQLMVAPDKDGTTVSLSLPLCRNEQGLRESHVPMESGYNLLLTELSDVLPDAMFGQDDVF